MIILIRGNYIHYLRDKERARVNISESNTGKREEYSWFIINGLVCIATKTIDSYKSHKSIRVTQLSQGEATGNGLQFSR